MRFSLVAEKFRDETKRSWCFVGVQGERWMKESKESREGAAKDQSSFPREEAENKKKLFLLTGSGSSGGGGLIGQDLKVGVRGKERLEERRPFFFYCFSGFFFLLIESIHRKKIYRRFVIDRMEDDEMVKGEILVDGREERRQRQKTWFV